MVIGPKPNFTIADYSVSADCENCSFGHCLFKVTLKVDGQWINLSALQIKEYPTAQIENDGTVTLNSGIDELTLEFTTVTNVQSIRLNVTKSNLLVSTPSTNPTPYLYLREIIPEFFGKF